MSRRYTIELEDIGDGTTLNLGPDARLRHWSKILRRSAGFKVVSVTPADEPIDRPQSEQGPRVVVDGDAQGPAANNRAKDTNAPTNSRRAAKATHGTGEHEQ